MARIFPSPRLGLLNRKRKDTLFAILLLLPTVYVLCKVFIYPIYQSAVWSLFKYNLTEPGDVRFIGWGNYLELLKNHDFWVSIDRTFYFTILSVAAELVLGFFSALLLNQSFKGRTFFRGSIIVPWALLTLVNGLMWNWIYQPGNGALSQLLHRAHLLAPDQNPVWLGNSDSIMNFVILADVWKTTPFMTLLLLAGMQHIPGSLYEAAAMDGAGFWKKLKHVTIPQLMPSVIVAVVLRLINAIRVYDILTVFTGDPTTSVSYLTFNNAFRYFYLGRSSAMAWLTTLFIILLIVVYMILLRRNSDTD